MVAGAAAARGVVSASKAAVESTVNDTEQAASDAASKLPAVPAVVADNVYFQRYRGAAGAAVVGGSVALLCRRRPIFQALSYPTTAAAGVLVYSYPHEIRRYVGLEPNDTVSSTAKKAGDKLFNSAVANSSGMLGDLSDSFAGRARTAAGQLGRAVRAIRTGTWGSVAGTPVTAAPAVRDAHGQTAPTPEADCEPDEDFGQSEKEDLATYSSRR